MLPAKDVIARLSERLPDPLFYRLLAWQFRRQEPELHRLREFVPKARPAIDVGAWWGPWTYWLSRWVTSVTAIEPQPRLARFLEGVVAPNVTVHNAAASDAAGAVLLHIEGSRRGRDALASVVGEGEGAEVPAVRLDDLGLDDIGFVKIDVEGHEDAVLRGAASMISACRPVLFVEIEQRHVAQPIAERFAAISALGYAGAFLRAGDWWPLEEFDVERDQLSPTRRYVNNFLFRPV